jgi:asparagine N-glycosylation enzyme membrane subunit Stt3
MLVYFIIVFSIVVVTSALLLFVFNKVKILNNRLILAMALSSVLASLLFPGMFNLFSIGRGGVPDAPALLFVFISTMVLYIMLTFILSIIISVVIPDITFNAIAAGMKGAHIKKPHQRTNHSKTGETGIEEVNTGENYLEQIYTGLVAENTNKDADTVDIAIKAENNLEKSVDSGKNIDKMGLEAFEQDYFVSDNDDKNTENDIEENEIDTLEDKELDTAESLSLNDCVDMAFKFKEQGDFEGAILYYMYALDRNPDKDLVFWIVLDICVLYKALGQVEFAHDILSSYVGSFSDVMDISVKDEIEKNLLYIRD